MIMHFLFIITIIAYVIFIAYCQSDVGWPMPQWSEAVGWVGLIMMIITYAYWGGLP